MTLYIFLQAELAKKDEQITSKLKVPLYFFYFYFVMYVQSNSKLHIINTGHYQR